MIDRGVDEAIDVILTGGHHQAGSSMSQTAEWRGNAQLSIGWRSRSRFKEKAVTTQVRVCVVSFRRKALDTPWENPSGSFDEV